MDILQFLHDYNNLLLPLRLNIYELGPRVQEFSFYKSYNNPFTLCINCFIQEIISRHYKKYRTPAGVMYYCKCYNITRVVCACVCARARILQQYLFFLLFFFLRITRKYPRIYIVVNGDGINRSQMIRVYRGDQEKKNKNKSELLSSNAPHRVNSPLFDRRGSGLRNPPIRDERFLRLRGFEYNKIQIMEFIRGGWGSNKYKFTAQRHRNSKFLQREDNNIVRVCVGFNVYMSTQ